ncbi:MAG: hypothetical protein AAGE01_16460 [Pseudomonadota bacterium]
MRLLPVLLLLLPELLAAQDVTPVVRTSLSSEEVRVGEPVRLTVTVLVPTWFPKPPVFPSFELPNAIVRLPPDSSYPTSERVGRDTWSGIVRNYEVYPLLPATYAVGGQSLRVTWADPPRDPHVADVPVPVVELAAVVPPGAEGLNPYLAGRSLTVERRVVGEVEALETGDALVLEYVAELDGLPAMFLPPLVDTALRPGLAIYADEPKVEDGNVARRTERVTLVFELGGGFALPAPRLRWFNTETGTVEVAEVPAMTVEVAGEPPPPDEPEVAVPSLTIKLLAGLVGAGVVLWLLRILARRLADRRRRWRASEAGAFAALREALGSGDGQAIDRAFATWLARADGSPGPVAFARRWGDADLVDALDALARSRFGREASAPKPDGVLGGLSAARKRYLVSETVHAARPLPPLNP